MKDQLYIQQNGYYYNNTQNKLTENWNNMIMKLQCCGVFWFSDTSFGGIYEYQFCCKNAHESRMDAGSYYTTSSNNLDYFGSCGGYKRDTCTGKIVFKTKMFIGWFLGIVSVQIIIEIIGFLFANKEYSLITSMDIQETKRPADQDQASNSKTILLRKIFGGYSNSLLLAGEGTLGLAIYVRYDSVFGNIDIQALLSEFIIADQTLTGALNMFSIVLVTFSSVSIALLIFTVCSMVSPKWKRLLMFINVGLWCFITVANLVQIGLWKEFMSQAKCCGVRTEVFALFGTSYWRLYQADLNSQIIPVQCCKSQTEVYPYGSEYDFNCTHTLLSGYYYDQIGIIATTIFYEFIMTKRDNAIGVKVENIELKELKESEES
ncbi:unnamed protein product [Mytilus edulis]|uniref:Uncharacterized protein n=1 Tax=Mytilus edulis TaxID=6550 RepID=A0A8S3SR37_MYTED|nr:unnamed protein product [Mytilus edulis]